MLFRSVRRDDRAVLAGDGQVTLGTTVLKQRARKIRRLYNDSILAGFAGAVARGTGLEPLKVFSAEYRRAESLNPAFATGKDAQGNFVADFPVKSLTVLAGGELAPFAVDAKTLALGQAKFQIYCAVCHGQAADGNGIMKVRSAVEGDVAIVTIANLQQPLFRAYPQGQVFDVITNGFGVMPDYRAQIPAEDRWKITAYIRALQISHNATVDDVPASERGKLDQPAGAKAAEGEGHKAGGQE